MDAKGLLDGSWLGLDATMVEANAAMQSIVRKDTKEGYREYVDRLWPKRRERKHPSQHRSVSGLTKNEKGKRPPTKAGNRSLSRIPVWDA